MESLETNTSVKHFLLGNNMIGPVGARSIANFSKAHPSRIQTWYLAGNCIDSIGLKRLVSAWAGSKIITNIWLKRNPLSPSAVGDLATLITQTPNLRTLDLDQTQLSDEGVAGLFESISSTPALSLRNIYLNGDGISTKACKAIASFLASSTCKLESIYMSSNPVGDAGAIALAAGLKENQSLKRLCIASCGIKTAGAARIFDALTGKPEFMTLAIGQHYATEDLGMRYNYLEDGVSNNLLATLSHPACNLKMLTLDTTAINLPKLHEIYFKAAASSCPLMVFEARTIHGKMDSGAVSVLHEALAWNVANQYEGMEYGAFEAGEKRWLISPRDVRLIDSGYRNRDAGLARRGKLVLKKWWDDGGEEVERVMSAEVEGDE